MELNVKRIKHRNKSFNDFANFNLNADVTTSHVTLFEVQQQYSLMWYNKYEERSISSQNFTIKHYTIY